MSVRQESRKCKQSSESLGVRDAAIAALIGYASAYFYFAPDHLVVKLIVLWTFGVPLVLTGAGVQWVCDHYSRTVPWIERGVLVAAVCAPVAGALICAWKGSGFLHGLSLGFGAVVMAGVPLFLGACLGESEPRELHDARFGSEDQFRQAGMSDER